MTFRKRENTGNWKRKHYITLSEELFTGGKTGDQTRDEEEDVRIYRKTLRKMENTGNWKRKHYITLSAELVTEGKIEGSWEARRRRRRKHLQDDLKENGEHWKLKEEALYHTAWRTCFGRGCGPYVRQTTKWMYCLFSVSTRDVEYSTPNADVNYQLFHTLDLKRVVELTNLWEDASDRSRNIYKWLLNVSKAH